MNCRVCGRQFDPQGFQVMVPGIPHGFDRVDCALEALAVGVPPERRVEPEPAPVPALPAPLAAVPAFAGGPAMRTGSGRQHVLTGANLALLAAGTAATIYLWLRVFGPDLGPIAFPASNGSEAHGRTAVAATVDLTPATEIRPEPEATVRADGSASAPAPSVAAETDGDATLASNRTPAKERSQQPSGPVTRPGQPAPAPEPTPPPEPGPTRSAPAPTFPVPSSPPSDRVPGPALPGGTSPEQPRLPGDGSRG